MFDSAKQYLYEKAKKHGKDNNEVPNIVSISNVWCWLPDDISQWTIIRSPSSPLCQAEAIWIMYENWNHERVAYSWYCQTQSDLDEAIKLWQTLDWW